MEGLGSVLGCGRGQGVWGEESGVWGKVWGEVWKSVWSECGGCGKVCLGVGRCEKCGGGVRKCGGATHFFTPPPTPLSTPPTLTQHLFLEL